MEKVAQNTFKKKQDVEQTRKPMARFTVGPFLRDRRTHLTAGIALICLSFFLLISLVSHVFTGRADQSLLHAEDDLSLAEQGREVENWMGYLGAWISDLLMYQGFGLASIMLAPLVFALGYWVVFKRTVLGSSRPFARTVAALMIWLSAVAGLLVLQLHLEPRWSWLSGAVGYEAAGYLHGMVGWAAWLVMGTLGAAYVIFAFNVTSLGQARRQVAKSVETIATQSRRERDMAHAMPSTTLPNDPLIDKPGAGMMDDEDETDLPDPVVTMEDGVVFTLQVNPGGISGKPARAASQEPEFIIVQPTATPEDMPLPVEALAALPPSNVVDTPFVVEEMADPRLGQRIEHYDPTLDLSSYKFPVLELLDDHGQGSIMVEREELEGNKNTIVTTLQQFGIGISSISATIGPTVTLYKIVPDSGVRISKIKNLEDDIALSLAALGIRIIAPIPGEGAIGIEVPNKNREVVSIRSVLSTEKFRRSEMDLPVVLGKTISNEVFITDLAKMPHLLMAGATGQGKSVGLNVLLTSLIYKKHPSQLKFVLVDPKRVELSIFSTIERHFLAKLPNAEEAIITDTKKVVNTLNSLCILMEYRLDLFKDASVRNLKEYNAKFVKRVLNPEKGHQYMPYIVVVIDELADLMMTAGKEVETPIARLAQLARATGIHLVVATQRPSVNVITGIIKANFPARLSFRVTSKVDSRTILDQSGADRLIGYGDMLLSIGQDLVRLQCPYIATEEVERLCAYVGEQRGYPTAFMLPEFLGENDLDDMSEFDPMLRDKVFDDAARVLVNTQQGSVSTIQRKLGLGYARAGRLMDQLEAAGIVGPFQGSKPREVMYKDINDLEAFLRGLDGGK